MVVLSFGGEMLKVSASAEVTRELNASVTYIFRVR